ncbi:MAG: HPr-rel-A system PqqD family peptide chaperone [Gammaproteobacteria bacterium]
MGRATDTRWRLVADVEFLTREWDGEFVLYHQGSGDTHLLEGVAAHIFRILLQHPASPADLSAVCPEQASPAELNHILGRLQRLDIVEPISL